MKKWQYISLWSISLILFLVLISWTSSRYHSIRISQVDLRFENRSEKSFLDPSEIDQIVRNQFGEIQGLLVSEINKALLEESIENHPTIAKAEVYSDLGGMLWIRLWQHEPIARIMSTQGASYLLESGSKMPLSQHYSEAVPLVSGSLNEKNTKEIANFFTSLKEDEFFHNAFSALSVDPDGNWTLYPKHGNFKIQLGEAKDWEQKLRKLRVFYEQAPVAVEIKLIREIDLRFAGQLICRKR